MGATSRNKGARGEVEVRDIFRSHGWVARRNFGSGSQGGGDIAGELPDVPEVKRVKRTVKYHEWVAQAAEGAQDSGKPWSLWIRVDGAGWNVTIPYEHYMNLLTDQRSLFQALLAEGVRDA